LPFGGISANVQRLIPFAFYPLTNFDFDILFANIGLSRIVGTNPFRSRVPRCPSTPRTDVQGTPVPLVLHRTPRWESRALWDAVFYNQNKVSSGKNHGQLLRHTKTLNNRRICHSVQKPGAYGERPFHYVCVPERFPHSSSPLRIPQMILLSANPELAQPDPRI
jgi:hypothetical protein